MHKTRFAGTAEWVFFLAEFVMSLIFEKIHFGPDLADFVRDFDCRADRGRPPEPWEEEVNEWIKADVSTDGAQYRMTKTWTPV